MPIYDQQGNPVSDPFDELDALFKKYGFTGRPGANQAAVPLEAAQGGTGTGDFAGLSADPRFAALTQQLGLNNIHPVTPQERAGMMDPNGPGNGEGGSTLQNLGLGASFLLGGSGIAGMLGAPGLTGAQSLGAASWLWRWNVLHPAKRSEQRGRRAGRLPRLADGLRHRRASHPRLRYSNA